MTTPNENLAPPSLAASDDTGSISRMASGQPTKLQDASGRLLGYLDRKPDGSSAVLSPQKKLLGRYDPATNLTRDASRREVGRGNLLVALLRWDPLTQAAYQPAEDDTRSVARRTYDYRVSMARHTVE